MDSETRKRWQPWILATLPLLVAGGFLFAQRLSGPCSDVAAGTIRESQEFTPYSQRLTHLPEGPIVNVPRITPLPPRGDAPLFIDGRPMQYAIPSSQGPYLFYLDVPLGREMTRSEFLMAGGIEYHALSMDGGGPFAWSLLAEIGDRATSVQVGEYAGALVWADPTEDGVRAHGLYWADSTTNYSLVAVRGPEYLLNLGRGLVCRPLR